MSRDLQVTIELNPKERRLYDRLRGFVLERAPGDTSGVRDLLLLLPDMTVLLARLLRDRRVPRKFDHARCPDRCQDLERAGLVAGLSRTL